MICVPWIGYITRSTSLINYFWFIIFETETVVKIYLWYLPRTLIYLTGPSNVHSTRIYIISKIQERCALDATSRFNMGECNLVSTLMQLGLQLDSTQQLVTDEEIGSMIDVPYRSAIGRLVYFATCTRPEPAAAVSEFNKFSQNPRIAHREGFRHVLWYLTGTVGEGLMYKRGTQVEVWGYSDSGHAGDKETAQRMSGYVFISAGVVVSWRSSMMLYGHSQ